MHANLYATGRAQFISITDEQAMQWGLKLSKMEGIIPAIETAHAFAVLDEMKFKPEDIVVINLSGRGDKDLNTYIDTLNYKLVFHKLTLGLCWLYFSTFPLPKNFGVETESIRRKSDLNINHKYKKWKIYLPTDP
jgi:threonine synthase